jgi:hypothetical protein
MTLIGSRLCLLVAGATLIASAAFAQAPNPTPNPTAPLDSKPGAKPTAPAEDLSKKLNRSNGVIHPKEVDPAIEKGAPSCEIRTWSLRRGLRAGLPRRSQNERRLLAICSGQGRTTIACIKSEITVSLPYNTPTLPHAESESRHLESHRQGKKREEKFLENPV